ncbi:MAG TPA: restriction endonuclease subunit S [Solidesulfovibrio magneticus]|nr:restriction endonuclease subunit S [Solidesulfovibrio magneticus]
MEVKPGYKMTEVGVIPEDWEATKLGRCSTFKTGPFGSALHQSDYVYDGVPVVNPMQILDGTLVPTSHMSVAEQAARRLTDFRICFGDIVIGRRGEMGRCAYVLPQQDGWLCGTGSMIIRVSRSVDARFIQRLLASAPIIAAIENTSVGSTMINLNQSTLENLVIPLPPTKAEQEAIASALSDVDVLIESLEQLIAKKRNIKQGAMQELLTGKRRLPGFQQKAGFKDSEVGLIPEDWELCSLSEFSAFITKGSTPTTYGFGWESTGVLFLRSECVSEHGLDLSQSMFISEDAHSSLRRSSVKHGDILVTITGNVGRVVLFDLYEDANINQHIARVRIVSSDICDSFVYYFLSLPLSKKRFNSILTGQAYPQISLKQVRDTQIPLPSTKAEQEAIAVILSDMDADITSFEVKLSKARHLKQAMMQELLTGRIRLV